MPKKGILSQKKFFPRNGDVLIDGGGATTWECARAGEYADPKTGTRVRFCLLIGRNPALGDQPIPLLLEDSALPLPFLRDIDTVIRASGDRRYEKNGSDNFEEA